jgi:hypothetical protein
MTDYPVTAADLQAVFRFFGAPALAHFHRHQSVPPACVLAWLVEGEDGARRVHRVHQFPTDLVAGLMRNEQGRGQLAAAIGAMLDPEGQAALLPPGPRPHLVVQVMQTRTDVAGVPAEVLLMLAHEHGVTHAAAVVLEEGVVPELPALFDVTSTPVGTQA